MLNESQADWLHLDVMDGRFVPNISFGLPVIEQIRKATNKPCDVHLMILEPEKYAEAFKKPAPTTSSYISKPPPPSPEYPADKITGHESGGSA